MQSHKVGALELLPHEIMESVWTYAWTRPRRDDSGEWRHSDDVLDAREQSRQLRAFTLVSREWHALAQPILDSMLLITASSSQHRAIRRLLKLGRGERWRWIVADYSSAWRDNKGNWRWKQVTAADKATYKVTLAVLAAAVDVRTVTLPLSNDLAAASIPASCTDLRVGAITQAIVAAHREPARIECLTFEAFSFWSEHEGAIPISHSLDRLTYVTASVVEARLVPFLQAATCLHELRLGLMWRMQGEYFSLSQCVNVAGVSATIFVHGDTQDKWAQELVAWLPGQVSNVHLRLMTSHRPSQKRSDDAAIRSAHDQRATLAGLGRMADMLARELRAPGRLPALAKLRLVLLALRVELQAELASEPGWLALSAVCAKRGITVEAVV